MAGRGRLKYSWVPLISALVWGGTIIALLVLWLTVGPPSYKNNVSVIYISYAGAKWKALFVAGACVTSLFYVATLIMDFELRRHERIPVFLRRRESVASILSLIFGTIGALGLALLTIFDVHNFHTEHWTFTVIFIVGVAINAVCNSFEIKYLANDYEHLPYLRRNTVAKVVLVSLGIIFAITMGILMSVCSDNNNDISPHCNRVDSTAAVLEWLISVIFFGFLLTYVVDFRAVELNPQLLEQRRARAQAPRNGLPAGPKPAAAPTAESQVGPAVA